MRRFSIVVAIPLFITLIVGISLADSRVEMTSPNAEPNGWFGYAVADAGDVNGDGINDIVVGAPQEDPPPSYTNSGRAYLFSGATGLPIRTLFSPNETTEGWPNNFGWSVCGVGDINGSGYDDVLVGSPFEDIWGEIDWLIDAGRAYVFEGSTGGVVVQMEHWAPHQFFVGLFGYALDVLGDVNDDDIPEMLVGSVNVAEASGAAFIMDGASGAELQWLNPPDDQIPAYTGAAVAGVDDIDGDSIDDALVGAPWMTPDGSSVWQPGAAYLFSGATGGYIRTIRSPDEQESGDFGAAVANLDDVNGDGISEIVIGATIEGPTSSTVAAGRVHIVDPTSGITLLTLDSPFPEQLGRFGASVAEAPDLGGDGIADVLVGARTESTSVGGIDAGRVYVFCSATGVLLCTLISPNPAPDGEFGMSVATTQGTVTAPSKLLIGAHKEDPNVTNAGRVYAVEPRMILTTSTAGGSVVLNWTAWPGAEENWVFGAANNPWFAPGMTPPFQYRLAVVPGGVTSWSTTAGAGDPDTDMTFLIIPIADEAGMFQTNRAGEFDFSMPIPTAR